MRADRLLAILLLLQRHGKLSAGALAERLEVSERTVYRDVEALSSAGVPVYTVRGRHGGISLVPGYRSDLTGLTSGEAQALFLFTGRGPIDELGRGDELRQAIRKLLAAVPEDQQGAVDRIAGRFVVDPTSWRRGEAPSPHLAVLQQAVLEDRRVAITYDRGGTSSSTRDHRIEPLGLVAKAGVWYVLAETPAGTRTFRVERIRACALTDETFERPPDLDVAARWEAHSAAFVEERTVPSYIVTVRIDPEVVKVFRSLARLSIVDGPDDPPDGDPDRRAIARLEGADAEHAASLVLPFAAAVEVVDPPELRSLLVGQAEAVIARYRP